MTKMMMPPPARNGERNGDKSGDAPLPQQFELGDEVHLTVGFNAERLASLDVADLVDHDVYDYDQVTARLTQTLETYSRLPELQLNPGITAIFGENGSGKTMLADVIVEALKVERFRAAHGLSVHVDIMDGMLNPSDAYRPRLSGRTMNVADGGGDSRHARLITKIAQTMDVTKAVLHDMENIGDAMRTPVALGNVAMGMSSRQAVDYLDSVTISSRRRSPSVAIYDEPELGMSPRRHLGIIEELQTRVTSGSVELVPSNSPIIYSSDLPRIDLDTPERGVFEP